MDERLKLVLHLAFGAGSRLRYRDVHRLRPSIVADRL